jgi:DNA-directed RNA polymerase subunit beta
MDVRYYGKTFKTLELPDLMQLQRKFYAEFLQADTPPQERKHDGLEAVFREVFPIESYDGAVSLEYLEYQLGEPRHTAEECRQLRLTYAAPLKVRVRLNRTEPVEEWVYLGEVPLMIGGGEFVVNGAERCIVTQLQRSPGVDFSVEVHSSGKRLHSCRIIPERGSWIQVEVTSKDILSMRIDRSAKIAATSFLRALSEELSTSADILRAFYETEIVELTPRNVQKYQGAVCVSQVIDNATGEIVVDTGVRLTDFVFEQLKELGVDKIEIIPQVVDELILNTLAEDDAATHEEALRRIYVRLRPGTPVTPEKARELFEERFFDERRYSFGEIGRFRLNRKFGVEGDDRVTLGAVDMLNICHYILKLRAGEGEIDDIDHLENRRARSIKDLLINELRNATVKLRRSVREQMVIKEVDEVQPHQIINAQTFSSSLEYFFARGELSQVVDQSNPLSQLVHERRLSALGPGGLNRKRAGFEVRDVHTSHYGRICPVETPEGTNIGLIVSLANYAWVNDLGFIVSPYYKVEKRRITGEVVFLRADEERDHYIAQADVNVDAKGTILTDRVICRYKEETLIADADQVSLVDVAPKQLVGISASLIPFLEHDDANRALMGSNMQRQAVPLVKPEAPLIGTGMEREVVRNSGMVVRAKEDGEVTYADALEIRTTSKELASGERVYPLHKYKGLNDGTTLNQTPLVRRGDTVKMGDPLSQGAATAEGELALGRNVFVAFMSYEGCNFEDAVLASEKLIIDDAYTSVHIEEFTTEIRETKVGSEEITRDIPGVSEAALANLDEDGLVRDGTRVEPGDILVGKIAPKAKSEFSSEEKLLRAIFGRAGEDVKNDSLTVPPGTEGYVIDVKRFSRRTPTTEEERRRIKRECAQIERETQEKIVEEIKLKFERLRDVLGEDPVSRKTGRPLRIPRAADYERMIELQEAGALANLEIPASKRKQLQRVCLEHDRRINFLQARMEVEIGRRKRGDELRPGVLEMVKVYVAVKRKLSLGDKMAGRHGNKGVVSRILPEEDMPFLEDGTSIEMILNPLGVPSRMNVGQILETHLGWAASKLGFRAETPVFDGADEEEIFAALEEAGLPKDGKTVLLDGRTGEPFHEPVTVGMMYMLKLHHLVADKIHARATGPYSLITQQPLGGKARNGGQRFGEMEVWALEAYGAANVLQELLTVKSDDVDGRTKIYEAMVKGENTVDPGIPVSFDVLCNEIRGIGLNFRIERQSLTGAPAETGA